MRNLVEFQSMFTKIQSLKKIQTLCSIFSPCGFRLFTSVPNPNPDSSILPVSLQRTQKNVAIFWDLDNKPPKSYPPYDAAVKLKKAAQRFGLVKYMIAYANSHSFRYVPPLVRAQRRDRKTLNELENAGVVKPDVPYKCGVCGRRFYTNERLVNHFKQIHEREQMKRLNQIESARGKKRVNMVARYAMKMDKYKIAAREILTPRVGYGLADELKRAGYWVRTVSDKPQAADVALRREMVDMMDKRLVDCVFLVSDDSDFSEILKEARLRCLKTVVVGDVSEGALKRVADGSYSWQEVMIGKAKEGAGKVVGKWKDQNVLQRLEWRYDPEKDKKLYCNHEVEETEDSDMEWVNSGGECDNKLSGTENDGKWWELEPRATNMKKS